jgi:mannitol operon transcriptional antiterminator
MYISARERQILDLLLHERDHTLTAKEMADRLGVSTRTIHRDLHGLESLLEKFHLSLRKQTGKGISIQGSTEAREALKTAIANSERPEITADERKTLILCELLEASEPIKLISLADDLDVTVATISHDLDGLESWLESFDLKLIRKRSYGIEIIGSEKARRRAMSALIEENLDVREFVSLLKENLQKRSKSLSDVISKRLLGMVNRERLSLVEQTVGDILHDLPYSIADSAFIGLIVHLALAVERIKQGEKIDFDPRYLEQLKATPEYKTAKRIAGRLEESFETTIPDEEIGYITVHLRGAKRRYDTGILFEDLNSDLASKVKALIHEVDRVLGSELIREHSLFQGLMAHLESAIYRIKQQLKIYNPLLDQIRSDYSDLFRIIKQAANEVFVPLTIPDEEVGFLVLHFGSALEQRNVSRPLKAVIICSSGIGSSKMLASRVQKEIPEIKELQNASLFELNQLNLKDYDLILSTIPLPLKEEDYIIVNPLLTEREIENIRDAIQQEEREIREKSTATPLPEQSTRYNGDTQRSIIYFEKIKQLSNLMITILENHHFEKLNDCQTIESALSEVARSLKEKGIVSNSNLIVEQLLARQRLGGLGIPGTNLALYHCRSKTVLKPSFSIYSLIRPLAIPAMDNSEMEAKNLLLQLAPEESPDFVLDLLSTISSLIVDSDESILVFESENPSWIVSFLSEHLEQYFFTKLKAEENGK